MTDYSRSTDSCATHPNILSELIVKSLSVIIEFFTHFNPFQFYFILNVAVGGQNGFFPDVPEKPWKNSSPTAMKDFWEAKDQWYPTWNGEDAAMKVNYIRAWKLEDN